MDKPLTVKDLNGRDLEVYGIDFETYYSSEDKYTLRKMTTIQYIRDERFKAHGCSVIDSYGKAFWVTHKDLEDFFSSIDWTNKAVCCHNSAFDMLIANEHYGVQAGYCLDTLSMSRGEYGPGVKHRLEDLTHRLGLEGKIKGSLEKVDGVYELSPEQEEDIALYAIRDIEQTLEAFKLLYYESGFPEKELHLIDITIKAFAYPKLRVDPSKLKEEIELEEIKLQNLLNSVTVREEVLSESCAAKMQSGGIEALMRSRDCFAELLKSRGIQPPLKERTKNGEIVPGEWTYAFAKNDIEMINLGNDPRCSDLVALWTKSHSTLRKARAQRFLDVTIDGTRSLPIPLTYCGGRTHRWSGGGSANAGEVGNPINPQNLSSGRDGEGARLRESIIAPPGYVIVSVDSSQGECRTHAYIWDEDELLQGFVNGEDVYSKLASEIFNVPVTKHNEYGYLRHVGKEGELSLGFGVGYKKFFNTIQTKYGLSVDQFSEDDAKRVVEFYRAKRKNIVKGWAILNEYIGLMVAGATPFDYKFFRFYPNKIRMPNELCIHYKNLRWSYDKDKRQGNFVYDFKEDIVKIYAAKLGENLTQSVHRTAVAQQLLEIAKCFDIVFLCHDECAYLAKESEAEAALEFGIQCLSKRLDWCPDLPLAAEGVFSHYYAH